MGCFPSKSRYRPCEQRFEPRAMKGPASFARPSSVERGQDAVSAELDFVSREPLEPPSDHVVVSIQELAPPSIAYPIACSVDSTMSVNSTVACSTTRTDLRDATCSIGATSISNAPARVSEMRGKACAAEFVNVRSDSYPPDGGFGLPPPEGGTVDGLLRLPLEVVSPSSSMTLNVAAKPWLMFPVTETMFVASSEL